MRNDYEKALYIVDMNNGFVNFGAMANPEYNKLVPEQLKIIKMVREEDGVVNFVLEGHNKNSVEFKNYPKHCVLGTPEAELIPELINEQDKDNTKTYYKNSINGMLNKELQKDLIELKKLKIIIVVGVCADLCVMDFVRTLARFLDEIDREVKIYVVKSAIDTFDSPDHNKEEWLNISYKVMAQAGVEVVENSEQLKQKVRVR